LHPLSSSCLYRFIGKLTGYLKWLGTALSLCCLLAAQPLYADDVEYKIKAGYLYNFTKFITWPEDKSPSFNLCILGEDPFGDLLTPIEQRTAFNKPIRLFKFENTPALRAMSKSIVCHILFVSSSINPTPSPQEAKNILIVGDSPNFAANGGMIGFVAENSRIKLQLNWPSFKQSDLKVSAKLLEVSEVIQGTQP
jgi:hypothetical protein